MLTMLSMMLMNVSGRYIMAVLNDSSKRRLAKVFAHTYRIYSLDNEAFVVYIAFISV